MKYFFFDQDGDVYTYDSDGNYTNCTLGEGFCVEDDRIIFLDEEDGIIDSFTLFDFKLFDKII